MNVLLIEVISHLFIIIKVTIFFYTVINNHFVKFQDLTAAGMKVSLLGCGPV